MLRRAKLFSLLVVAIVAFIIWLWAGSVQRRAREASDLEAALQAAHEAGLFTSASEIPKFSSVPDALDAWKSVGDETEEVLRRSRGSRRTPPPPNAFAVLGRTELPEQDWKRLESWLDTNKQRFDRYEAAANIATFTPNRDYSQGLSLRLPEIAPINAAIRGFAARAVFADRNGNFLSAIHDLELIRKIQKQLASDVLITSNVLAYNSYILLCRAIERIANNHLNDAKKLSQLSKLVQSCEVPDEKLSLSMELIVALETSEQFATGQLAISDYLATPAGLTDTIEQELLAAAKAAPASPRVFCSLVANFLTQISRVPDDTRAQLKICEQFQREAFENRKSPGYALAYALTRPIARSAILLAQARDIVSVARLCLQIAIGRCERLPKSLDTIRSEQRFPSADGVNGKPFIFQVSGDRVSVYSVGENGRDDGGSFSTPGKAGADDVVSFELLYNKQTHTPAN